jgi:hypothetical protein
MNLMDRGRWDSPRFVRCSPERGTVRRDAAALSERPVESSSPIAQQASISMEELLYNEPRDPVASPDEDDDNESSWKAIGF